MNRHGFVVLTALLVFSAFFVSFAFGGNTYAPNTFAKGMTPLTTPTTIWPATQNYTRTTFTKGMTALTGDTIVWNSTNGSYDDAATSQTLGFTFQFYGTNYTTAYFSTNGLLTFVNASTTIYTNQAIPTATAPSAFAVPFWDDLYMRLNDGSRISYKRDGAAPNRTFTVQWWRVPHISSTTSYYTAQVIIYETSNTIEIHYDTANQNWYTAGSATIGIENPGGSAGLGGPNTTATNNTVPTVNYRFSPGSPVYDDASVSINLPFSFTFFGNNYVQVHVSTNGFLSFTNSSITDATNDSIPSATDPDDLIALFWDDLIVDPGNGIADRVEYETAGTAPNRTFAVQWFAVTRAGQASSELTGQIVLYETSHRIEVHYDTNAANNNWVGVSSTIGIEDSTGANGFGGPSANNNISGVPSVNYRWDPVSTFTLQVTSAQGTPSPAQGPHLYNGTTSVTCNANSPVAAGAGQQYRCTGWTGTGSVPATGTATSVTFTILQNSSITWNWVLEVQLNLLANPAGGGNPSSVPVGPFFQPGTMVQIHANPTAGFVFNNWSGGVSSINNPENFTINSPTTITANYIPPSITLTVNGNPGQYGTPTPNYGVHSYSSGNGVTCSTTSPVSGPTGTRYICTGWTGTGDVPASGAGLSVNFTVTQTSTITWNWQTEYLLTLNEVPVGAGTTTASPSGTWFTSGQSIQVTANPNTGYQFSNWTGALTSAINPDSFVINAPSTATANYTATQYSLTVVSAQGAPTPAVGAHNYSFNTNVSCSVSSPVSGGAGIRYTCTGWTGIGDVPASGSGTSVNVNITQNSMITWTWQTEYETTLVSNPAVGGSIAPTPAGGWYTSGTPVSFLANPNSGYSFQAWSSGLSGATNPDNLTVTGPVTVTADFLAIGPSLTVISAQGSPTPAAGTQAYLAGTLVSCSVPSPATGGSGVRHICTGWTGTGDVTPSGTGTSVSVTLNSDSTITWNWVTEYEVTGLVLPPATGSVSLTPAGPWYAANTTISATATPASGYQFISWSGGLQSSQNPAPLLVDGAKSITANFIGDIALGIYAGPANPCAGQELINATDVPMLQLALMAGQGEAVTVASVRLSVSGASDESSTVSGVNLYRDLDGDGAYNAVIDQIVMTGATFAGDDGNFLFTLIPAIQVPAGGVAYLLATFDLNASAGDDFQLRVASSTDVNATSMTTSTPLTPIGAPVVGGIKTAANAGATGSFEVVSGSNGPGAVTQAPGSTAVPLMQFILRASSLEGATVTNITFTASGTGNDLSDLTDVSLHRDVNGDGAVGGADVLVASSGSYSGDDGTVSFTGLSEVVAAGSQVTYLVTYDFLPGVDQGSFTVQIVQAADITVTGNTSASALTANGTPVNGGLITLGVPPAAPSGKYSTFAGGCGGPALGGLPLLPLLPFGIALWFFARRRRRRD